jgi:hypothetical protein
MSKETIVFLAGMCITLVPFLGIPELWRHYVIVGIGILLIIVGYALRRAAYLARIDSGDGERGTDSFVETTEKLFDERALE